MSCMALGSVAGVNCDDCVELSGGFQGLSGDLQVESSGIDNSLVSSVNEQFVIHRFLKPNFEPGPNPRAIR